MTPKPAVGLVAVAGRRRATLEMAQRLEREGFTGLHSPSPRDGLALCEALALSTREIPFGTSIANIYTRHPFEYAQMVAVIHELSGGRFRFGIGVSHGPTHQRLGLRVGRALGDIRELGNALRGAPPPRRGVCGSAGRSMTSGSSSPTCAPPPRRSGGCRRSCWPRCADAWWSC